MKALSAFRDKWGHKYKVYVPQVLHWWQWVSAGAGCGGWLRGLAAWPLLTDRASGGL